MSEPEEERASPLVGQLVLLAIFVALLVVGIVTVVVPELSSDPDEDGEAAETADVEEAPAEDTPDE